MTYVVTEACIKCKYTDCVEVCPVDCFYEGENMLVIHPDECIDCGVCEPECPADAIKPDTEPGLEKWLEVNTEYAKSWPNITQKKESPPDAKDFEGMEGKFEKYFSPAPGPATDWMPRFQLNPITAEIAETAPQSVRIGRKSLIFAENVLYWAHYKPNPSARVMAPMGSRAKHRTGAWQFRAQAVSQKTRKKSASKGSKKAAAASRGATKSRARAS